MSAILFLIIRLAMALVLLGFLGWALWILWNDLRFQSRKIAESYAPRLTLTSNQEPAISKSSNQSEVYLGRDSACGFYINDPTLSARHARLQFHHGQWWIEDMNSSNGTYINDSPVTSPVVITSQDKLRFGELCFSVKIE